MMNTIIKENDTKYIAPTYARSPLTVLSGKGAVCYDENGQEYLDFTSGIGVNSLGFCDGAWTAAVSSQAARLNHISNLYYTEPCAALAEKLVNATGYSKVFFANSGAEANEGAIKAARKYSFDKYSKERNRIISLKNSFHGRTVTTLSATGQDSFHNFFFPFTEGFDFCESGNIEQFQSLITDQTCGVILEFVQGEGGVNELDKAFVDAVFSLCKEKDLVTIADEVQTGMGRCGTLLASELYGVKPNITTLAKGLGGGLPIGAFLLDEQLGGVLTAGHHGSTFGGNPICCAGALTVMDRLLSDGFLESIRVKSELLRSTLKSERIRSLSGLGLMVGIELIEPLNAAAVRERCLELGLLVLTAKSKVRLLPPLTISDEELKKGLAILSRAISEVMI